MNVIITGTSGFIGMALTEQLLKQKINITSISRKHNKYQDKRIKQITSNFSDFSELSEKAFNNIDCVIYLAAINNFKKSEIQNSQDDFYRVNCDSAINLALLSAKFNVRRFIYMSSIKADPKLNLKLNSNENIDYYAYTKFKAEKGLLDLPNKNKMSIAIIRSPLVYGPGVNNNFRSLIKLVKTRLPIPLGSVNNKRSFIAIENLVNFIILCMRTEKFSGASNQIFSISDNEDVSTSELLRKISKAYGIRLFLVPFPLRWLRFLSKIFHKTKLIDSLVNSSIVDMSQLKSFIQWKPKISMDEQLRKIAKFDERK